MATAATTDHALRGVKTAAGARLLAPSPAGAARLASDEVHVWCADLDVPPDTLARLYSTLSVDERKRSARFRFQRDRRHFVVSHGILRDLLARDLQTKPDRIRYVHNAFGKPALGPEFGGRLQFNLSHSAGLALIAIAAQCDVGVDVERIRVRTDYLEIARHFFSPAEVQQLSALPSHRYAEAFLSCWTKKEACLKAHGAGLSIPLHALAVPLKLDPARAPLDIRVSSNDIAWAERWSIHTLRPAPEYIGALALGRHHPQAARRR